MRYLSCGNQPAFQQQSSEILCTSDEEINIHKEHSYSFIKSEIDFENDIILSDQELNRTDVS